MEVSYHLSDFVLFQYPVWGNIIQLYYSAGDFVGIHFCLFFMEKENKSEHDFLITFRNMYISVL